MCKYRDAVFRIHHINGCNHDCLNNGRKKNLPPKVNIKTIIFSQTHLDMILLGIFITIIIIILQFNKESLRIIFLPAGMVVSYFP